MRNDNSLALSNHHYHFSRISMKTNAKALSVLITTLLIILVSSLAGVVNAQKPAPAASAKATGFDAAAVPASSATLGAWPYVGALEGYEKLTVKNRPGDSARELMRDVGFDRYEFFDGQKLVAIEGRRMSAKFIGKGASFFQVKKNYETVLKGLGGVTVFEGKGDKLEAAKTKFESGTHRGINLLRYDEMGVYFLRTADKEIWVEVYRPYPNDDDYWLTVVEKKALTVTLQAMPAEDMKKALDANGRVALYINFDTNKATLKPDASATVAQIVKLLSANPALKVTVEGHTDNVGKPADNLQLSSARANTVVGALMTQGIAFDRLEPKGFGQTRPLADNATEDGRAKNRRVELVKR
jgi:OmpA-OmpF porin, OOP family